MNNVGDYSSTFLPILVGPSDCRDKNSRPNPPLTIAWASQGRNHFIPILPVRNTEPVIIPLELVPPVWCANQEMLQDYTSVHTRNNLRGFQLGAGVQLSDQYLAKLIKCMRGVFHTEENVPIALVSKLYRDVYRETTVPPIEVTQSLKRAMATSRCYLCHYCGTVSEVDARDLKPDGAMFEEALYKNEIFKDNEVYELDNCLFAKYSDTDKELKLIYERSHPKCHFCNYPMTCINVKQCQSYDPKKFAALPNVRRKVPEKRSSPVPSSSLNSLSKSTTIKSDGDNAKAGKSDILRVKVVMSDGRNGVMEFTPGVSVSSFLSLLSEKFSIPIWQVGAIRCGHPPRIVDQTKPQQAVTFQNGDKVQITLVTAGSQTTSIFDQPSSSKYTPKFKQVGDGWDSASKVSENLLLKSQTGIPSDVKYLWEKAEENKQSVWNFLLSNLEDPKLAEIFKSNGGYVEILKDIKGEITEGQHYTLMRLSDCVFCYENGELTVCCSEGHLPINDTKLYTITANDLRRNCVNLNKIKKWESSGRSTPTEAGPGVSRLPGNRAPIRDATEELRKRLKSKR